MYRALVLDREPEFRAEVRELDDADLPEGDVTLDGDASTLNYKDALAITNSGPVVRSWPMVAGIDGAGTVSDSTHPDWSAGDRVVLNGWGVGETHPGCMAGRARLRGEWLVRRPEAFDARQAMAIGTAGDRIDYTLVGPTTVALVQVGAIVVGHVAGTLVAHDRAVGLFPPAAARRGQLPVLVVMVALTCTGIGLLFSG